MNMVSYDRQTVNAANPIARFAHRSRVAKSVALAGKYLQPNGTVVDFGAGTGLFLSTLGDKRSDAVLYAIEPFMPPAADPRIRYVPDFEALNLQADLITSFEVCEHLFEDEVEQLLGNAVRFLKSDGKLIISVPIMIGGALILKELNKAILNRRGLEYSSSEIIAGIMGRPVERPAGNRWTHKGFDFRWLRQRISERFVIERETLSPLPLPWWANSQIFFICRKP
jgi:2-polyprenyl-3-methyl-5-hydroxy-6-metoxy-1,4-benzoquinol methylase